MIDPKYHNHYITTETWLMKSEIDKQWLETTQLNRHPYNYCIRTDQGRGGGLLLSLRTATKQRK